MFQKCLTLLLCLLALMPKQFCTCALADEQCHSDENAGIVAESDHEHSCDSHQHHDPILPEPIAPDHEHESDCLITQPLPPMLAQSPTLVSDFDLLATVILADGIVLDFPLPSHSLNWIKSPSSSPPHVPLFVSFCNFRN